QLIVGAHVDEKHLAAIKRAYTEDVANRLGHLKPDERAQLEQSLKAIDEEESRTARLFASGKITETVWDSLWRDWQDRRHSLRVTLEEMRHKQQTHISNLELALTIIANLESCI